MTVDLLDAPLRISWDIPSQNGTTLLPNDLLTVADRVAEAGVFFVSLEGAPLRNAGLVPLVAALTAGGCQVSVLTDGSDVEVARLQQLETPLTVFLDAASAVVYGAPQWQLLEQRLQRLRAAQVDPALWWIPRAGQCAIIPEFIDFCLQQGIARFKLPNQKIDVSSEPDYKQLPAVHDLELLRAALAEQPLPQAETLQLDVHDLFIWELLQPLSGGQRSEYGGCQAGNSLGHIGSSCVLYPCSSWPEPLGNLLQDSLLDLWESARRLALRREVATVPRGCDNCNDYKICFGGCRGLSRFCRADGLERDLLCSGRR